MQNPACCTTITGFPSAYEINILHQEPSILPVRLRPCWMAPSQTRSVASTTACSFPIDLSDVRFYDPAFTAFLPVELDHWNLGEASGLCSTKYPVHRIGLQFSQHAWFSRRTTSRTTRSRVHRCLHYRPAELAAKRAVGRMGAGSLCPLLPSTRRAPASPACLLRPCPKEGGIGL